MACAKLPCGNSGLENFLHGGYKEEQMAYALLCPTVVFFVVVVIVFVYFQGIDHRPQHGIEITKSFEQ